MIALNRDKLIGIALVVGGALGIFIYGLLLFFFPQIVLQITAFIAVAAILGVLIWIGWTMARTPSLEPVAPEAPASAPSGESQAGQEKEQS